MKVPRDQIRTRADEQAIEEGCTFDESEGLRLIRFIETYCRPSSGRLAGKGWKLFDWQRDVCLRLWSWKRPDHTRRFRSGYCSVARQNGKSALCSWLSAALLLIDDEDSPAVASAALTRDQSSLIFDNLKFCIDHNERLKAACHVQPYKKTVSVPKTHGKFFSLSREAHSNLGTSLSGLILDEFAFWPSGELADALRPAMAARRQPLTLSITTASTLFTGPGYDQYLYARKVLDGAVTDTSFFAAVYEADDTSDVMDEAQWHKANPALKHGSLSLDELREAATRAAHSKAEELAFRYYRLNKFTKGLTSFVSADKWDGCAVKPYPDLTGQPLYLGLDLAHSRDLCGLTGVIPYEGKFYVLAHAWAPAAAGEERERNNQQRYQSFAPDLTITPGNGTDYRIIRAYIRQLAKRYDVKEIIADPAAGANETLMELMEDGFTVFRFGQSARNFNNPIRRLETMILDRELVHDGADLLRWQMMNFHTEAQGDWTGPVKAKDRTEKNDNVIALLMALSRAVGHDQHYKPRRSVYEDTGLFVV